MRTKHGFDPESALPSLLSDHADEPAELRETFEYELRGKSHIFKASVLALATIACGVAIALSFDFPAKLFADATASLPDGSTSQHSVNQPAPTIPLDAQAEQTAADAQPTGPTADAQVSAPTVSASPAPSEIVAAPRLASQTATEEGEPPTDALFAEFQAWASRQTRQAQNSAQPSQDATTRVSDDAPGPVRRQRRVRSVEKPQTESRHLQKPKAKNAPEQAAPAQDVRAQPQPVQDAEAPSLLQRLGFR